MFDLNAPIIPGESAAGVRLGQPIKDILAYQSPDVVTEINDLEKYQFGSVHLWVNAGKISQIGLYAEYRGRLKESIGIGSTIEEVQNSLGKIEEDEDDNLVVAGISGFCFETEEWLDSHQPEKNPEAKISELYVF